MKKDRPMDREERRERRSRMAAMVRSGVSLRMTAARFGVSQRTVRLACDQNDVAARRWEMPKYVEVLGELFRGGRTQAEIARYLEVSEALVSMAAKWAGDVGLPVNACVDDPSTIRIIDVKLERGS